MLAIFEKKITPKVMSNRRVIKKITKASEIIINERNVTALINDLLLLTGDLFCIILFYTSGWISEVFDKNKQKF